MRFLFGLIIGAMLTILVATAVKIPTKEAANYFVDMWGEVIDKVAQTEKPVPIPIEAPSLVLADRSEEFFDKPHNQLANNPVQEQLSPWLPEPLRLPPSRAEVMAESVAEVKETEHDLDSEAPMIVDSLLPETETAPPASEVALGVHASPSSKTIWEPFHSEVSATGFANRLSLQLGYPFQVTRDGPARYLVVFNYDSDEQRALLMRQIDTLTGYRAP